MILQGLAVPNHEYVIPCNLLLVSFVRVAVEIIHYNLFTCLLYTSDAADEEDSVDLGGRRIIKKKKTKNKKKKR